MSDLDLELERELDSADAMSEGLREAAGMFLAGQLHPGARMPFEQKYAPHIAGLEKAIEITSTSAPFYGTILLMGGIEVPWLPTITSGLMGVCRMVDTREHLNIRPSSRDSNWAIMIAGQNSQMCIPGCQVKMVYRHSRRQPKLNPNIAEVP